MNTKQQGDIGVAVAISYYTRKGYAVSVPLTDNTRYDLLVDDGNRILRVQCKSTGYKEGSVYRVQLATSGGNQSWNGEKKRLSKDEIDLLFVYTLAGDSYEFPPSVFDGKNSMGLGDSKNAFRVD
jgi:hypothetical protein